MKVQFDHIIQSSFYLWFDDQVTRQAEAVTSGISQNFYYSNKGVDVPSNLVAYYSPDRQLVANGETVPSGVYVNGALVNQGTNNLMIDFDQGRVVMNADQGTSLTVSGNFDRKDVNVYITNDSEEQLLLNNDFVLASDGDTWLQDSNNLGTPNYTIPAAFVSCNGSDNAPFAFGGLDETTTRIRTVFITEDNYTLDGMLSLFRDTAKTCFPLMSYSAFPFGEYFHIKEPPYSYTGLKAEHPNNKKVYIDEVTVSKLYDRSSLRIHKDLLIGFADFDLQTVRLPRTNPTEV